MNDMEYTDKEYCLEVWGDWACFTRPELKVERVSYDVITPSAARAIFEAILFKRYAMRWQVTKIEVLRPIKWATISLLYTSDAADDLLCVDLGGSRIIK